MAQLSSDPKFPIAPRPFSIAKLTIVLNMTSRMPVDHRVVPWEPANEDIITGIDAYDSSFFLKTFANF